jgi:hypothetical protein
MLAVKVCAKAGIGRKAGHKKPCFRASLQQNCLKKENSSLFKMNFVESLLSEGESYVL